jgi:hypothetical protein
MLASYLQVVDDGEDLGVGEMTRALQRLARDNDRYEKARGQRPILIAGRSVRSNW